MMADKVTIDLGSDQPKHTVYEAMEKLGKMALKLQESDAMFQRIAQQMPPDYSILRVDTDAIYRSVSDVKVDPIIPDGYFEKTQEYQQKSLEMLQSINENTANLYTMVELINQNNEKQDELLALMTEILSLAKAKSKADAQTLFKKIMGKINDTTDNVDTMIKIVGWATAVYNMVQSMLP